MEFVTQHKFLSLILLVALIGAAWWGFTGSSHPASVLSSNEVGSATGTQDAQIVSVLLQLQAVSLSGPVLRDPGFLSLQDFTTQVVSEPIGRQNPFAPLSPSTSTPVQAGKLNPNLFAPAKH